MAVPEKYRTGRRLLGGDDASLMPHRQPAGQSLQDLHSRRGIRWRRTRCFGWRLRSGLLNPALTRMRRRVVLPMSMPSRSLSNSLRWVWLVNAYLVRAR